MFVYNVKFDSKKIFKLLFGLMIAFGIIICLITVYKIIFKNRPSASKNNEVYEITSSNYTNILKSVHDDIDTYVRTEN